VEHKGYIKLYRQIQDKKWWRKGKFTWGQAWVDMLLEASHKDTGLIVDYKQYDVPIGSFVTSQRKLAKKWRWSISTVNAFLNFLQKTEQQIRYKTEHSFTHIYILNWKKYQIKSEHQNELKLEYSPNTPRTVTEHSPKQNNNDKNDKNVKKDNIQSKHVKELTPLQKVVKAYYLKKEYTDTWEAWCKLNFKRNSKSAKQLLDYFGDYKQAVICIDILGSEFEKKVLDWTFETIVKHASEYKLKQGKF